MKLCTKCGLEKPLEDYHKDKASRDGHRHECKPCKRALDASWNKRTADQRKVVKRNYRIQNLEKRREYKKRYAKEKPEIISRIKREERARNLGRYKEQWARRRAKKLSACPEWVSRAKLREIYENRPEGHHVDHIVPLQGEHVSGLHVPWNLQYLPAVENMRKSNKWPLTT